MHDTGRSECHLKCQNDKKQPPSWSFKPILNNWLLPGTLNKLATCR